jgi:hypothetical protein
MRYGNVKDADGFAPPVPDGSYIIRVDEIRDADKDDNALKDKNGLPYVWIVFRVDGESAKVWDMMYPDPQVEWTSYGPRSARLKEFLTAIQVPLDGGDTADWVGKKCRAKITVEDYKGRAKNRIEFYEPIESREAEKESFKDDDENLPF